MKYLIVAFLFLSCCQPSSKIITLEGQEIQENGVIITRESHPDLYRKIDSVQKLRDSLCVPKNVKVAECDQLPKQFDTMEVGNEDMVHLIGIEKYIEYKPPIQDNWCPDFRDSMVHLVGRRYVNHKHNWEVSKCLRSVNKCLNKCDSLRFIDKYCKLDTTINFWWEGELRRDHKCL